VEFVETDRRWGGVGFEGRCPRVPVGGKPSERRRKCSFFARLPMSLVRRERWAGAVRVLRRWRGGTLTRKELRNSRLRGHPSHACEG
jgi:hypothetical protein